MSETRVFFPSCPSRFDALMAEFLFRVDPARTACKENGVEDEYVFLTDDIGDHLEANDGVMTEEDWDAMVAEAFGTVNFPFTEKTIAVFKVFFPEAIVHVNGEML